MTEVEGKISAEAASTEVDPLEKENGKNLEKSEIPDADSTVDETHDMPGKHQNDVKRKIEDVDGSTEILSPAKKRACHDMSPEPEVKSSSDNISPAEKVSAEETPQKTNAAESGEADDTTSPVKKSPAHDISPEPDDNKPVGVVSPDSTARVEEDDEKRESCQYGDKCYRKNPRHKDEEAHPGDPDYEKAESAEDEDERPDCQYGRTCYRKNPAHVRKFKHTGRPKRKAAQARRKVQSSDSEADSDPDFDDEAFIDDDSSDEFRPQSDSDSDEEYIPNKRRD